MKPEETKKASQIVFRLSQKDRAQLDMLATRRGVKISALIREALRSVLAAAGQDNQEVTNNGC